MYNKDDALNKNLDFDVQCLINNIHNGLDKVKLNICSDDGHVLGVMRPLVRSDLENDELINQLTDWRNNYMENFLTNFVATTERTRNWMCNVLFKLEGQMLFLVWTQHQLIGHLGFKNLTSEEVLLDNAIRGNREGDPRLLVQAGKTLIRWLFEISKVNRINTIVMAENVSALMMNKQIGFIRRCRYPLTKSIANGEVSWNMGEGGQKSPDGRYCYLLFIERSGSTDDSTQTTFSHAKKTICSI